MIVREMRLDDIPRLKEIHEKFFKNEFEFPDYENDFLCAYVITDSSDCILIGGGIKLFAEASIISDKERSKVILGRALIECIRVFTYLCNQFNFSILHANVDDEQWKRHLIEHGFEPLKGHMLSMKV